MHSPSESRKLVRDVVLTVAGFVAVLAVVWLVTWALCEMHPSHSNKEIRTTDRHR